MPMRNALSVNNNHDSVTFGGETREISGNPGVALFVGLNWLGLIEWRLC